MAKKATRPAKKKGKRKKNAVKKPKKKSAKKSVAIRNLRRKGGVKGRSAVRRIVNTRINVCLMPPGVPGTQIP